MSVQDMIKKSVLESGMFSQYDIPKILAALAVALILGSVIYLVYQKYCDFSWYGWCIVYCTFSYSN